MSQCCSFHRLVCVQALLPRNAGYQRIQIGKQRRVQQGSDVLNIFRSTIVVTHAGGVFKQVFNAVV